MRWGDEPYALPWEKWLGKDGEGMVARGPWRVNLVLFRHSPGVIGETTETADQSSRPTNSTPAGLEPATYQHQQI